jgi:hypothetical protein
MACQKNTETRLEEEKATSEDMDPEMTQEVPVEDAARMLVGVSRMRRRDRNEDARRRRKQEKRTQIKNGCRKDLVAARRGTTHRAAVARRRRFFSQRTRPGNIVDPGRDWSQPLEGRTAVQQLHGARKISSEKVGSEMTLYEENLEHGRPGRDVGWIRRAHRNKESRRNMAPAF